MKKVCNAKMDLDTVDHEHIDSHSYQIMYGTKENCSLGKNVSWFKRQNGQGI